jgi:hypothetical protein
MSQKMPFTGQKSNLVRHGLYSLKSKLERGKIDLRSAVGQAMKRRRADLENSLGGRDQLSAQETALLDRVVVKVLVLESVEAWALKQPRLVRRGGNLPPVLSRNYLSWSAELRRDLLALGLSRRAKVVPNLASYLAARRQPQEADSPRLACHEQTDGDAQP